MPKEYPGAFLNPAFSGWYLGPGPGLSSEVFPFNPKEYAGALGLYKLVTVGAWGPGDSGPGRLFHAVPLWN